jgi:sortase (surface protein transpeptidase)
MPEQRPTFSAAQRRPIQLAPRGVAPAFRPAAQAAAPAQTPVQTQAAVPVQPANKPVNSPVRQKPQLPSAAQLAAMQAKAKEFNRSQQQPAQPQPKPQPKPQQFRSPQQRPQPRPSVPQPLFERAVSAERAKAAGRPSRKKSKKGKFIALTAVAAVLAIGVFYSLTNLKADQPVAAQSQNTYNPQTDSKIVEDMVSAADVAAHKTAAAAPRRLGIASIGVDARVFSIVSDVSKQPTGLGSIFNTGWHTNSSKPGEKGGATLIEGLVHGQTKPGVFYNLKKVSKGDIIELERGDGGVFKYKVVKTELDDASSMGLSTVMKSAEPDKAGLNIVTSLSNDQNLDSRYNERLVVFAVIAD